MTGWKKQKPLEKKAEEAATKATDAAKRAEDAAESVGNVKALTNEDLEELLK